MLIRHKLVTFDIYVWECEKCSCTSFPYGRKPPHGATYRSIPFKPPLLFTCVPWGFDRSKWSTLLDGGSILLFYIKPLNLWTMDEWVRGIRLVSNLISRLAPLGSFDRPLFHDLWNKGGSKQSGVKSRTKNIKSTRKQWDVNNNSMCTVRGSYVIVRAGF